MSQMSTDLDPTYVAKIAEQALQRPRDYMRYDDRLYDTHGCVMAWADRGDDVLAESNYKTAVAMLEGAVAHDETGASEARGDDVMDTAASHWLVGSVRELFVRVYDENGEYTPAFLEAVNIIARLGDYPVLNESDLSEREYEQWEAVMEDALHDASQTHWEVDEPVDDQVTYHLVTNREPYRERLFDYCGFPADEINWKRVQEVYDQARDEHFGWLAERQWAAILAELPEYNGSQMALPGL